MDDLEVKMAIDNTMKKDLNCAETSSPLFQEIWAMMDGDISFSGKRAITVQSYTNQIKTQETGGGGEEAKVEADAYDEEASIVEAFLIEKVNGYKAHEFEEMARTTTQRQRWLRKTQ